MERVYMGKVEKWSLFFIFIILSALLIISSTDLIIKEDDDTIKHISVIVNDSKEDYWINYKKGMEKAANKGNIEIEFITISDKGDTVRQIEIIKEEIKLGADAIIISPTDSEILRTYLNEAAANIPVITIGANIASEAITSNVGADYYEIGLTLGDTIIGDLGTNNINVMAFAYVDNRTDTAEMYSGLHQRLEADNVNVQQIFCDDKIYMESYIKSRKKEDIQDVIICLDAYTMEFALDNLEVSGGGHGETEKSALYGVGYTNKILHYLETGFINGLIVYSNYDLGYMSVERAQAAIDNKWSQSSNFILDYKFIRSEDLYLEENQLLLFPKS